MRIAILTRSLPPYSCGIGDHSLCLANALSAIGHEVVVVAGRGAGGENVHIAGDAWGADAPVREWLLRLAPDQLILQFTPLMFSEGDWRIDRAMMRFWRELSAQLPTSVIVHETYFRTWRHPSSLVRGSWQKRVLKTVAKAAGQVFSASQPLLDEMRGWGLRREPERLPIGSNTDVVAADRTALRSRYGIGRDEILLTLFGSANNLRLMRGHLRILAERLHAGGIRHRWLPLGGVTADILPEPSCALSPGWLPAPALSAHLQMTDIFLMPHRFGINAKRGTLATAMDHGLAVVATTGPSTDSHLASVAGLILVPEEKRGNFSDEVLSLCRERARREALGALNKGYFDDNLRWPHIAERLLKTLSTGS